MSTALITGATAGIGNMFARQLAARGTDLVLVARDLERLENEAENFRSRYGVRVEVLRADLSDRDDVMRVAGRLEDPENPIDMLVNNAGFGLHSSLLDDIELHDRAFEVMGRTVFVLAAAAARAMSARGEGKIVNVSSTSGLIYSGNYSAIKAWCTNYTQSLAVELHGTGVSVTALLPGWVRTEFHQRANISAGNLPSIVWIRPEVLVRQCLADVDKGKVISVPTLRWRIASFLAPRAPQSLIRWLSRKLNNSRRKDR